MMPTIVDKGMQAERTRLSWNRTGLAIAVNAALLIRADGHSLFHHLPAAVMFLVALACFFYARRRYRVINHAVRGNASVHAARLVGSVALLTIVPAVIALVAVLS